MGQAQASDRPGHSRRPGPGAVARPRLVVTVEIHAGRRGPRRGLPEIDRDDLAAIGQVGHEEASSSQIPRLWHCHRQREGRGNGRINGVAAGSQHVPADVRRLRLLGHDDVPRKRVACPGRWHSNPEHEAESRPGPQYYPRKLHHRASLSRRQL